MRNNNHGFTLVEILVALGIGTLMMLAIYSAVNSAQKSSSSFERKVTAQQDARSALELMVMEIRMASYNPTSFPSIWVSTADCTSTSSNLTYRGIQEATANSLAIEMDIDDNSVVGNNANEIIRYNYDTVNQYLTRTTNCGTPTAFLGDTTANDSSKTVLVVNNSLNPVVPVFRYYDGAGAEITAPVTTNIPNIRRIEITLVVDTAYSDPSTGGRKRLIYSTSVIPRNHLTTLSY